MGTQDGGNVKIGLALGGGGARGYAHFGVLFALESRGIVIDCVAGTSMGAAVGALWATDQHVDCYKELTRLTSNGVREYLDPELPLVSGILKGDRLYRVLESWFKGYRIEHLSKEFRANAVELETGREVTFFEGSLACAVRASVSLPVILAPWRIGHRHFLDGGVANPLPVRQCFDMGADLVIAVNLLGKTGLSPEALKQGNAPGRIVKIPSDIRKLAGDIPLLRRILDPVIPEVAFAAVLVSQKALTDANLNIWKPSILIEPDLGSYTGAEFHLVEEISEKGISAVEKVLPELQDALS